MSKMPASNGSSDLLLSSTEQLFSIWSARYLSESCKTASAYALESAASLQGRQRTVEGLRSDLVKDSCKRAALRTKDLYTHHQNLNLKETAELAQCANLIYPVLLDFYRTHEPMIAFSQSAETSVEKSSLPMFAIPEIHALGNLIEPLLSEFQSDDVRSTNWQTRSFLTTELNLSGQLLLEFLSPAEQILLNPYFAFLEEYVAIPWQRVCLAAVDHSLISPHFKLVERMLPKVSEISMTVYSQGCRRFGDYYNRRGQLDNPGVKHSSLRDLDMFQAYLWLCVLQGDLEAIEQELFVLCDLVYRGIGIPWDIALQATIMLGTEIMKKLDSSEQKLLDPYVYGLMRVFAAGC
ncbi:hypothetical protein IQ260_15055 [Leptolyngbya cf. ectocarpi LEGE 11479]|uniref:Uncharacterized protein n=1 Tax=Leptolyngbya cf. ectocarpi LEGE 11479 TaxID=1828722 RepID=A0A929F711_LEPEC|nr:hypothetical protein [Leptolyngbya ectocarpi]MBE9067971.1 hypothetical protein [Leptolyngbya cf. ectocarpi LEGE 11479]